MLYQIRERKRIPETSRFYTQKVIIKHILTLREIRSIHPAALGFCFAFTSIQKLVFRLFSVSCDNDEDPPLPPAVEKVVLAFGVDQGEGQLSAKPELENTAAEKIGELISPAEIAKGTTVHFRATHSKSWTIMYWKVNGVIIRSVEPEQTFVIDEHKEVRVAFKPYKSPEPEGL